MLSLMSLRSKRSSSGRVGRYDSVAVRLAGPEDEAAIARVAALDGQVPPRGDVLVAEADGRVIAALSVSDGHGVADPFAWTADVVALMEMRADQLADVDAVAVHSSGGRVEGLRARLT